MRRFPVAWAGGICVALLLQSAGCGSDATTMVAVETPRIGEVVPQFALIDVNPSSTTSQQTISPRNYLQQVSAWYFGHAT